MSQTNTIQTAPLFKNAGLSALTAAVINSILFFVFRAMGLIDPAILINGQELTVLPILMSSIIPTFVAALVFLLIGKFSKNPWGVFKVVAIVLLVLSFVNPFMGIPGISMGMGIALNIMHVIVFLPIYYFFPKSLKQS